MPLAPGTRLGSYVIAAPIGAGGMGEVYRAHDTTLGRDVAIKTLPDRLADDPERLARFRREAQVLAALNHPGIASIYGIEAGEGSHTFLVLELVDGETLAARIARGPLPVAEALRFAREIAQALAAAHDRGIVHRDLKPSNVALTSSDRVKVLDFGLAKAIEPAGPGDPENSPTITSPRDAHRPRRHPRHRRVYEPGTGEGARGRQAERHLGVRVRALRDADRPASVRGRRRERYAGGGAAERSRLERAAAPVCPRRCARC